MLSYHGNDSTTSLALAQDLGIRPDFYMDCSGGGSSTEALVGLGVRCHRSGHVPHGRHFPVDERLLGGPHGGQPGGRAGPAARSVAGGGLDNVPYGLSSPAQMLPVHLRPAHA